MQHGKEGLTWMGENECHLPCIDGISIRYVCSCICLHSAITQRMRKLSFDDRSHLEMNI